MHASQYSSLCTYRCCEEFSDPSSTQLLRHWNGGDFCRSHDGEFDVFLTKNTKLNMSKPRTSNSMSTANSQVAQKTLLQRAPESHLQLPAFKASSYDVLGPHADGCCTRITGYNTNLLGRTYTNSLLSRPGFIGSQRVGNQFNLLSPCKRMETLGRQTGPVNCWNAWNVWSQRGNRALRPPLPQVHPLWWFLRSAAEQWHAFG